MRNINWDKKNKNIRTEYTLYSIARSILSRKISAKARESPLLLQYIKGSPSQEEPMVLFRYGKK